MCTLFDTSRRGSPLERKGSQRLLGNQLKQDAKNGSLIDGVWSHWSSRKQKMTCMYEHKLNHFLLPLTLVAHPWLHYHLNLKLFHARCRTCPASFHFRDRQRSLGAQRVLIGLWKRMDPRHLGNCTAWDWTHQHFTSNMWERMDHQYQTEKTQRVSRCYVWGFAEKPAHICSAWSLRSTISW